MKWTSSYHTWSAKLAVFLAGSGVILLFAGGSAWLFRLATPVCVFAACEQIAITVVLSESRFDVRLFWHATGEAQTILHLATTPDVADRTGQYVVRQRAVPSSPASYDQGVGEHLWHISSALVGEAG